MRQALERRASGAAGARAEAAPLESGGALLLTPDRGVNIGEPYDPRVMPQLLAATPARVAVGRAGTRYRTNTMLRFRADHAAAKDAVLSEVDPELLRKLDLFEVSSRAPDKATFLQRPDLGRALADEVAARLVLYIRRPGFQSQFSEELVAQNLASDPLGQVIAWMRANLRTPLDVATVAHRAGMSVRTFHRSCMEALDLTPAKLVEKLRVEHARSLLTTTQLGTKVIAARSGFGSTPRMSRAFQRALGVTPGAYRMMFSRESEPTPSSGSDSRR